MVNKPTDTKDTTKPEGRPASATEQVVVTARPLTPPPEETKMGSSRAVHEKMRKDLEEGRAKIRDAKPVTVSHADAKIVPNIGQPRAQTSEEIRQDQLDQGDGVAKAGPYPGDPREAQVKAILHSERQRDAGEFNTEDLTGTSVDGTGEKDTVEVRLLFDWWDGCGVRHPLNSRVEMAMNDAKNLLDQRKAERTDPLRPMR